jgi:archaeal type IV pilus assembly protein PilA
MVQEQRRIIIMEESGISESIGIIVLIAITMVLAAAIAAYMFSMTQTIPTSYTILVTVEKPTIDSVTVIYRGGPDQILLNSLTINWPDGTQNFISNPKVGGIYGPKPLAMGKDHLTVSGNFTNNHIEQVVLNWYK